MSEAADRSSRFFGGCVLSRRRHHKWIVLATKQPNSADARRNISRQHFEILHLLYRKKRNRGIRKVMPLFPFYLLVRIDVRDESWKNLNYTRGVRRVFQNGCGGPAIVPDECVKMFKKMEADSPSGYVEVAEHEAPRFRQNETVEVREGWLRGCMGMYRGLAGASADRVRVLFSILGIPKVVELSAFDVAAVYPGSPA